MTRLVLIPGLGADAALFEIQRASFPTLHVPPWIEPAPGETLVSYAARMAERVPGGDDVILGGVSFGGMLACEMACLVRPRVLLLVATCTTPAAIPRWNRWLARLVVALPPRLLRPPRFAWPWIAWAFGAREGRARAIVEHCVLAASPEFVQWGLSAILAWQPSGAPQMPIVHVHGARDRLIPAARVDATDVVPGAGHLLNVTHAAALDERIAGLLAAQRTADSLREADTE